MQFLIPHPNLTHDSIWQFEPMKFQRKNDLERTPGQDTFSLVINQTMNVVPGVSHSAKMYPVKKYIPLVYVLFSAIHVLKMTVKIVCQWVVLCDS